MHILEFTLGQFIDNIEKNGLPQTFNDTFRSRTDPNKGGCALGQGYWNLLEQPSNITVSGENSFWEQFNQQARAQSIRDSTGEYGFTARVVDLNDNDRMPISEIVPILRVEFADHLNKTFNIVGV